VSDHLYRASLFWLSFASLLFFSDALCASDSIVVEIYEYRGGLPSSDERPVVLNVPSKFIYRNSGRLRTWGINLLTYYPSFASSNEPANAQYGPGCIGICNGRILISVENRTGSISSGSPNMGDFIARVEEKWQRTPPYPSNVRVHDISEKEGFDDAFERDTFASAESLRNEMLPARIQRTYFRKAQDGAHYDLTATCEVVPAKSSCILHFSLSCNPAIYVSIHWVDASFLSRAADIKEKADQFVSSMVREPSCST
jgi:hypothetical protein